MLGMSITSNLRRTWILLFAAGLIAYSGCAREPEHSGSEALPEQDKSASELPLSSGEMLLARHGIDRQRLESLHCAVCVFNPSAGGTSWLTEEEEQEARSLLITLLSQPECSGPGIDDPDPGCILQFSTSRKGEPSASPPGCLLYIERWLNGVFTIIGRRTISDEDEFKRLKCVRADKETDDRYSTLFDKAVSRLPQGPNTND